MRIKMHMELLAEEKRIDEFFELPLSPVQKNKFLKLVKKCQLPSKVKPSQMKKSSGHR